LFKELRKKLLKEDIEKYHYCRSVFMKSFYFWMELSHFAFFSEIVNQIELKLSTFLLSKIHSSLFDI